MVFEPGPVAQESQFNSSRRAVAVFGNEHFQLAASPGVRLRLLIINISGLGKQTNNIRVLFDSA